MSYTPLHSVIAAFSDRERANLAVILELDAGSAADDLCEAFRWLYWSKTRARLTDKAAQRLGVLRSSIGRAAEGGTSMDDRYPVPAWEDLVTGLARHLKVYDAEVDVTVNELYISQAIIVRALNNMTAAQRKAFFDEQAGLETVLEHGAGDDRRLAGPARAATALGLANAAGFSLYTASTTALGFVTHAVGITLPFAAFTGVSSSIAFMIGPVGWLGASAYAFWKATSTNWERVAPAIIYISNARAARAIGLDPSPDDAPGTTASR